MGMLEASVQSGQLAAIQLMAVALGLDAFSLGIGVGMRGGMRLGHMLGISFMIALFHMLMPPLGLFGMLLGHVTGLATGDWAGGHMMYNALRRGTANTSYRILGIFAVFA